MKKNLCFALFFFVFLCAHSAVFGIGMLTEPIIIEDVARNQEILEILELFNSESAAVVYDLSCEGQICPWASFLMPDNLNLPIDRVELGPDLGANVAVKFRIPSDVPNGKYAGQVIITTVPKQEEASEATAAVKLRIGRDVSISVTDKEIVKLESQIIPLEYVIGKNKPLEIRIIYNNQGNISLKPNVDLKILKGEAPVFEAIFPYSESEAVKPRENKETKIVWQSAGQEKGEYLARVNILLGENIVQENDFRFQIGFQNGSVLNFVAKIGNGSLTLGWFLTGGIVFFGALIISLIFLNRRKQKMQKNI